MYWLPALRLVSLKVGLHIVYITTNTGVYEYKLPLCILLENVNNENNFVTSDDVTLGISNTQIEYGGIPQGLDDPLEISNVSFNEVVNVHNYDDFSSRRLRDYYNVCSFDGTDCWQFLPYSVLESYFTCSRLSARALLSSRLTFLYEPQSTLTDDADDTAMANITTFTDDNAGYEAGFISARDDTFYVADSPEFALDRFFSRPVRVATYSWTVGTPFPFATVPVFKTFWENKRNINRVANYRNMKCDMCVKILVNGTPFHYGLLLANVQPDHRFDDFRNVNTTEVGCVRASQNPHLFLDPTTSTGGCLRLPYTHSFNCFDMTRIGELDAAGTLQIRELVPLAHVSGVIEPITVSIMAWAENVVLGAPTFNSPVGLVPQSGDEYGQGVVSRPAFILAKVAGALRSVPFIGPYAMASSIGANRVGKIAQIFGFIKPSIVTDIALMNPRFQPNMASTTQHDPIFKATLDDKQEVTVDPRVIGLTGRDEMSIVDIAKRESYLVSFPWLQTSIVDTRLLSVLVTPNHYRSSGTPGINLEYHQTPMSWVATPFQYWRGTMRFRFTAVASTFHRGRIRIVYEPGLGLPSVGADFNTNLTHVWDLSESKETVIEVGWHQPQSYLPVSNIIDAVSSYSTVFNLNNPVSPFANGSLALYVVNELTAPDTNLTSPVTILVSVSACDDFEVFSPQDTITGLEYFPQSGSALVEYGYSPHRNQPADVVFGNMLRDDATASIYHGDPIVSLRALLKRYTYSRTWGNVTSAASKYTWRLNIPQFPLYPGRALLAVDTATLPINFCSTTLLNYFSPAFLARRGGVRHRFVPTTETPLTNVTVGRSVSPTVVNALNTLVAMGAPAVIAREYRLNHYNARNGVSGWNTTPNFVDTGIDLEAPFHTNRRYWPARSGQSNSTAWNGQGVTLFAKTFQAAAAFAVIQVDHYVSGADDFALMGFIDVPITYIHTTQPATP